MSDLTTKKPLIAVFVGGTALLFHRLAFLLGYLLLAFVSCLLIHDACLSLDIAIHRGDVEELACYERDVELDLQSYASRDFDGDGVADQLVSEYHRTEPMLAQPHSGRVEITSGKTGSKLLSQPVSTPISSGGWVCDHNGDGLVDVAVRTNEGWIVYGFAGDLQ